MFLAIVIIPIYLLAIVAMFYMGSFTKALMFFGMLLIATFVLFLFINHPSSSAMAVISIMALFAFKLKD
ncbi:hypothetical protein EZ449_19795 [Pedobacter frigidisoli]|uniref:Uncharacterized protein n=1 Tax=Pedobacter frigidisoli TaxID=2530455 RepID=A0A4R0NNJ5_9SPHI|nr:hypothetical protein [Pedobacter frigidisoli]TCD00745.1 hypothetical protein EZ449_19795 [Pedobacter frigidisoli]